LCAYSPPKRESWNKRRQVELEAKVRILGDSHQLYKVNGLWFEIKAKIIHNPTNLKPLDIILEVGNGFMPSFKIILKHQLNSKELKKHGLKND